MTGTWEEAAAAAASEILNWQVASDSDHSAVIETYLDSMKETSIYPPLGFTVIGAEALRQYAKVTGRVDIYGTMQSVLSVVVQKQYDYGPQNILWGGATGIALRMHDKIARIRNLEARGEAGLNEPLSDSWLDLVGYAIVAVMLANGTFECPLFQDLIKQIEETYLPKKGYGPDVGASGPPGASDITVPDATGDSLSWLEAALSDDDEVRDALRQFSASATAPEYVHRTDDDRYSIEGGGTIEVHTAPDRSHTHVVIHDGEGGSMVITAMPGQIELSLTERPFTFNDQRLSVVLCMLLGAAEAALDWRNTNVTAEVPYER